METLPRFEMVFEPMTIEHLGLRLYSTLPPVISEFVSNAYDAESPKVEIQLPSGKIDERSEVVIRDFGHAMTAREIQDEFLRIGWSRRGSDGRNSRSKNGKRLVTGRKGLGKLSAFGIATEMEVRVIRDGKSICLRLNYDEMEAHGTGSAYRPQIVPKKTGPTKDLDGVEITLRGLHRKTPISVDDVRKGLATRLNLIGAGFQVLVNGMEVGPADRLCKDECEQSWDVCNLPCGKQIDKQNSVRGWIGFLEKSSQRGRGVDIYATGKAVELGSFFNFPSTHVQFARAHLVGQLHADFLDAPGRNGDRISTARNSVIWESPEGHALEVWGHAALKWVFDQWLEARRKKREEVVTVETGFDAWLTERSPRERKVAQRMVKLLIDNEDLEAASAKPLLEIVKSSVETVAFRDLVDAIESEGGTPAICPPMALPKWRTTVYRSRVGVSYCLPDVGL